LAAQISVRENKHTSYCSTIAFREEYFLVRTREFLEWNQLETSSDFCIFKSEKDKLSSYTMSLRSDAAYALKYDKPGRSKEIAKLKM